MASTKIPQSERYVFSLQSNGAAEKRVNASVRQDKARISSARSSTRQPAPETKFTRAKPLSSKSTRSQNRPAPNQKAQKLTLWVDPIVKEDLERLAKREGLSLSKSGAAFLKRSLQQNIDLEYSALLKPIIQATIRQEIGSIATRLAWLLVRVAFDTGQTRAIVTNILGRQQGISEDELKNILAMSQQTAKGNITRRTPQLAEFIEAVEKWLFPDNGNRESNLH